MSEKVMGRKNYGSIPHLPNSRLGPGDRHCHMGQAIIATQQARDKNDEIFVTEKLDGSNVGVYRTKDTVYPIVRAGYPAWTSKYFQHVVFAAYVWLRYKVFMAALKPGERFVGEWLVQAHGTRYKVPAEPFYIFDLMVEDTRAPYDQLVVRLSKYGLKTPKLIHRGSPISVEDVMNKLGEHGFHNAIDLAEGAVWRVERDIATGEKGVRERRVDFLAKYVRPDKRDGIYLPGISGKGPVWNFNPFGDWGDEMTEVARKKLLGHVNFPVNELPKSDNGRRFVEG